MITESPDNIKQNINCDMFNNMSKIIYNIIKDKTLNKNDKIEIINNYLSSIYLPFYNGIAFDKFFQILDELRKEKNLKEFILIIKSKDIENNGIKNLIKISFLKQLTILSEIKEEDYSFEIINYILENYSYKLSEKENNFIINFFEKKNKTNKDYISKTIDIIEKTKNLKNIYLSGLILGINNLDSSFQEKISKIFTDYFCTNILNDNEKDKNLVKERLIVVFLKYLKENFYNNILKQCLILLNRSSKNSNFIDIIFCQSKINYSKESTESIFKNFEEYFYPKSETKDNFNLSSFHYFSLNSNHITLINLILKKNFPIDKKEFYRYSIFFLIEILQRKNNKNKNLEYSKKQLGQIINFILSNFENGFNAEYNIQIEKYISSFVDSLIFNNFQNENEDIEESNKNEITTNLIKLIDNNEYSNFHNYFYLIGLICLYKFDIQVNSKLFNLLKNEIKNNDSFTLKTLRNIFPLYSFVSIIGMKNNNFYSQIKNEIYDFVKSISKSEIFKNNYNELTKYELISIYYCLEAIINQNTILQFENNNEDYNMTQSFLNNFCILLFKKQICNCDLIVYNEIISLIIKKENLSKKMIEIFFINILQFDDDKMIKIGFQRLNIFLKNYTLKYINEEIEDSLFLKYIILCHLPSLNLNMNIKYTQNKTKNKFVENLYKSEKKNILINKLETNINTLCKFIFSELGLFNIKNNNICYSCYSLIETILKLTNKGNILLQNSFGKLDINKFIFIDNLTEYYNKNIDLIGKFDLIEIIKTLKENNLNYKITNNWIKVKKIEQIKEKPNTYYQNQNKKNKNKKKQNTKDNKKNFDNQNKTKQNETKQEEEKYDEKKYKNYLINFCYRNINNLILILNRLKLIITIFDINTIPNYRENLQLIIKKLWLLLKVDFCHDLIKQTLETLFNKNSLTKNFSFELANLMYLEASNDKEIFNIFYDKYPNVIPKFNEVLNNLFKDKSEKNKNYSKELFDTFDFILLKILFFIILNRNIGIDDTVDSVENLILILTNLHLLNYDQISPLLLSLLKSDYTGENMGILLKLYFQNANEENFISLCNEILNYEYISKYSFLKAVIDLDMKNIRKYQSLHNKLFIICFEENESLHNLAITIMNKYNMIITEDFFDSEDFKNGFIDHKSKDIINKAIRCLVHIIPNKIENVLKIYMEFYEKELNDIIEIKEEKEREKEEEEEEEKEENNENEEEESEKIEEEEVYPKLRIAFLNFINECLDLFSNKQKDDIISFLLKVNDKENDLEMFEEINKTLKNISETINDEIIIKNIYKTINSNIKFYSEKEEINNINSNNLNSILQFLNIILIKTIHNEIYKKEKETIFDTIYNLIQKIENNDLLKILFLNFNYISSDIKEKSDKILDSIFTEIKNSTNKELNKGKIYCLSGIIKSFSIKKYKEKKIHDFISNSLNEKIPIQQKKNSMEIINILFTTLKKSYESFFVELFNKIYNCITNKENEIRESAKLNFKNLMKDLSGYAVNSIMPYLIRDLREMNWKSKVSNMEILGQFAFSTPKQLSKYIPKIIKEIIQILKDPHEKVQEIAENVLNDISSAIQNPEIVDISNILINAISNPYDKSIFALEALLETKFYHKFDSPALALIIPIIDYNLKGQKDDLKIMSSHILGSLQNLLLNPSDLNQYLDIIIPDLKIALFQSSPECRKEISKCIGNLCHCLGKNYYEEMINFCSFYLEKESQLVELTGASQAYAEILISFNKEFLDIKLKELINKIINGNLIIKEGYLSVFVFLTGCLGEDFQCYFDIVFPLIIEAFSNENEKIRNVSTKIFEICIIFFARKQTKTLVEPLLNRFYDVNWRIRNSSIALIKTLINNTGDEFKKESSEYFNKELRNKILSYSFILKGDNNGNTETIANMIWRDYVDNIPKFISKILKDIYQQLIIVLSDEKKNEVFEIGNQTVRILASKFSDKLFNEMMPFIKEYMKENKNNENIISSSLLIIYFSVDEISEKLLLNNKNKLIDIVNENLDTNFSSSRKIISEIIFTMGKKLNDRMMPRILIYNTIKLIRGKDINEQKEKLEIISRLVELEQKEILNIAIGEVFKEPYEDGIIELLDMINDKIIEIFEIIDIKNLFNKISDLFVFKPIPCIKSFVGIDIKVDDENFSLLKEFIEKISKNIEINGHNILFYVIELINNFALNYENLFNKKQCLSLIKIIENGNKENDLKNNYNQAIANILSNTKLILPASDEFDLSILNIINSLKSKLFSSDNKLNSYLCEYIIHLIDVSSLNKSLLSSCLSLICFGTKENKNKDEIIKKLKEFEVEENYIDKLNNKFN